MPALLKAASQVAGREMTLEEIFSKVEQGDVEINEVIEQYTLMLGEGIVNIVNMFRPQLVLLGGVMSNYADKLIEPIKQMVKEDCFGGMTSLVPEIAIAELGSNAGMIGAANL